jgi:transcriptional regulator with XRE-family HTH domain
MIEVVCAIVKTQFYICNKEVAVGRVTLQNLGSIVRDRRGTRGLREVAREIGTSPATLSRIEAGRLPDLTTFGRLCRWLEIDPSELLGIPKPETTPRSELVVAVAHLRAKREISQDTARSLANVIIRAQHLLADLPEDADGAGI